MNIAFLFAIFFIGYMIPEFFTCLSKGTSRFHITTNIIFGVACAVIAAKYLL